MFCANARSFIYQRHCVDEKSADVYEWWVRMQAGVVYLKLLSGYFPTETKENPRHIVVTTADLHAH
jgi:hypothetical protein